MVPPMNALHEAVDLLAAGDWQAAHGIAQKDGSALGAWAHGIAHLLEGDRRNAGYWYRRAERDLPASADSAASEIAALRAALASSGG